jgi:hypothetical protein
MCGYSTKHQSDFVENVWEYQLHFRVIFEDETAQGRKSHRQKQNKTKNCKQKKKTEELGTNMDKSQKNKDLTSPKLTYVEG